MTHLKPTMKNQRKRCQLMTLMMLRKLKTLQTMKTKDISNMKTVGGWIVKPDGIEFVAEPFFGEGHGYFIAYRQFFVLDWLEHLSEKTWFTTDVRRDFLEAYYHCTRLAAFEMFKGKSFSVSAEGKLT